MRFFQARHWQFRTIGSCILPLYVFILSAPGGAYGSSLQDTDIDNNVMLVGPGGVECIEVGHTNVGSKNSRTGLDESELRGRDLKRDLNVIWNAGGDSAHVDLLRTRTVDAAVGVRDITVNLGGEGVRRSAAPVDQRNHNLAGGFFLVSELNSFGGAAKIGSQFGPGGFERQFNASIGSVGGALGEPNGGYSDDKGPKTEYRAQPGKHQGVITESGAGLRRIGGPSLLYQIAGVVVMLLCGLCAAVQFAKGLIATERGKSRGLATGAAWMIGAVVGFDLVMRW